MRNGWAGKNGALDRELPDKLAVRCAIGRYSMQGVVAAADKDQVLDRRRRRPLQAEITLRAGRGLNNTKRGRLADARLLDVNQLPASGWNEDVVAEVRHLQALRPARL